MQNVSFFGLGVMGGGMARRLLSAGFPLRVWNRRPEPARALAAEGVGVASTPRAAAVDADVLVSMVADDAASRAVWLGDEGALAGAAPGSLLIECSTVSPAWVRELADHAQARGCSLLDAPVTGSKAQAAAGELVFLAGGDAAVLDQARPVLRAMSKDILHLGPLTSGARMKLVNNFVCGVQAAALAEALALVEASGLDVDAALGVLLNGAPGSPLFKAVAPRMRTRDYDVRFKLALMLKDLTYAMEEGAAHAIDLSTAATARQLFERAIVQGWADADFSAVIEVVRG